MPNDLPLAGPAARPGRARRALVPLLALLALGLLLGAPPAEAARTWCRTDPEFTVNGRLAHVYVSSFDTMHQLATGPTQVVVTVPPGAATEFLWADDGFGGWSYDVSFREDARLRTSRDGLADVVVDVYVPSADGELPVQLELVLDSTKSTLEKTSGKARDWHTVKGKI